MLDTIVWVCGLVWLTSLLSYALPQLYLRFCRPQNLKTRYSASWALVTGGSSGIGLAIVERLAEQGLNVVIAAYPDQVLEDTHASLSERFPAVEFRKVAVNLATPDFLPALAAATDDVDVSVLVNNAGYIKTGFFAESTLEQQLANHHCNATSGVIITHHFVSKMRAKGLKGCVLFTSSPACFMACPFSALYGATKAFITTFAQSLAPEIYEDGIDVCVIHPSPTATRFYQGTHDIGALLFFKSTATGPQRVADALLASVGRLGTVDQGYFGPSVKFLLKIIDANVVADSARVLAPYLPDYIAMKAAVKAEASKNQ